MLLLYSALLTAGFLLFTPLFLLRREKYAAGFRQRLGNYPKFEHDGREVVWLHCVSVGETNAARPLVEAIGENFPEHRLVISTTTLTGQKLAQKIFFDRADAVFYFPFDWKFSVRKALDNYKPSLVLLMETEIWPRFISEAKKRGAKIAIVNGRLSERSAKRYAAVRFLIRRVLENIDLVLAQTEPDAERFRRLGADPLKVSVTGNLKFEQKPTAADAELTENFRRRFAIRPEKPLIIVASTHEPEERYVLESLDGELGRSCRLMIAPRHPERFDDVARLLNDSPHTFVRRSDPESADDADADIILLDSIGELRSAYPLAEIVFVGGSLIPHGGQNVIEPAIEGKAIVTGPYTANFEAVVREFLDHDAIRRTPAAPDEFQIGERLYEEFIDLLQHEDKRRQLGQRAAQVATASGRDAVPKTVDRLRSLTSQNRER